MVRHGLINMDINLLINRCLPLRTSAPLWGNNIGIDEIMLPQLIKVSMDIIFFTRALP